MKRRNFLKMFSAVGVLPFVGGEPSQVETPSIEPHSVEPAMNLLGSANTSYVSAISSGTAMVMGYGAFDLDTHAVTPHLLEAHYDRIRFCGGTEPLPINYCGIRTTFEGVTTLHLCRSHAAAYGVRDGVA